MNEIEIAPLEGIVVEVRCQAHADPRDCRGRLNRAVVNPYVLELDKVVELIDVCDAGLDCLHDDI